MVKFAGITPLTKALRSQSIWYSFVVGSTSATSLRLVIMGSREMDRDDPVLRGEWRDARTRDLQVELHQRLLVDRVVPVSWMPTNLGQR